MDLRTLLGIRPGITALTGGGGKTTMLYTLAAELAAEARVICCTTTHMFPPDHMPVLYTPTPAELEGALAECRRVCVGRPAAEGKLMAPALAMKTLAALADYVLAEADGSRGLPCKAHLSHEPAVPPEAGQIITLVGASCFGKPIREAVHRPEEFCFWTSREPDDPVIPEDIAELLRWEAPAAGPPAKIFVNQVEDDRAWAQARRLAELLPWPVYAGALKREIWTCLS